MKRKLAMAIIICMIATSSAAFSQELIKTDAKVAATEAKAVSTEEKEVSPEKLKNIISDVKQRFVVYDQDANFIYSVSLENGINMYSLSWDGPKYGTYIKYGEDKNIYWYYSSQKDKETYSSNRFKQLPSYDKNHAQDIASAFLQKALPSEHKNFSLKKDSSQLNSNMYSFEFTYFKNNIAVDGITANILVDASDGKVVSYSTSLDSGIKYPDSSNIISKETAKNNYKQELGLKLIYESDYDYEKNIIKKINLRYIPNYGPEYVIDAKTGKKVNISRITEGGGYAGVSMLDKGASNETSQVRLTEQEVSEIKAKADFASVNQAKEKIKSYGLEILDSNMKVDSAQLYESKRASKSGYTWSLTYTSSNSENRTTVDLDAKTLELLGFNSYNYTYTDDSVTKSQIEDAKKASEKIIKKYSNISMKNLKLDENSVQYQIDSKSPYIYISYNRVENGIEFPENRIDTIYDIDKSKIVSYQKRWEEIKFPDASNVVSLDQIYDKIFKENDISLKYKISYDKSKTVSFLVYEVNQNDYTKPLVFDALNGKRIVSESSKKPELEYKDIEKSKYKDEVKTLLSLGIGFQGGELKPQENIRQDELLYLISQTFEYVPVPLYKIDKLTSDQKKDIERQLRSIGVLTENEIMNSKAITREETIKYLVRALGYEKIASRSEIFNLAIKDSSSVENSYKGYVAIGDVLNIITKDQNANFKPKDNTTREEALKMIHNYLK